MSPSRTNNAAVTACGGLVTGAPVAGRVPVTAGPGRLLQAAEETVRRPPGVGGSEGWWDEWDALIPLLVEMECLVLSGFIHRVIRLMMITFPGVLDL